MTNEGLAKLIEMEGEVLHAYQDSKTFWTIGVGHLIDERRGGSIPQRISRLLLEEDIARFTASCRVSFDWFDALDPVRQDVIVNLAFNMGIGSLSGFHLMIKAIQEKRWHDAAWELANSDWGRTVQSDRKKDLTAALEKGAWVHPSRPSSSAG